MFLVIEDLSGFKHAADELQLCVIGIHVPLGLQYSDEGGGLMCPARNADTDAGARHDCRNKDGMALDEAR